MAKMTKEELDRLIQLSTVTPPAETVAAVTAITTEIIQKCQDHFQLGHTITRPVIKYDLRGRVAGQAVGGHTIRLNLELLLDERYQHDMLNQTLPHELAHIVDAQLNGHSSHGWQWQRIMLFLGKPPTRCHQYEVTPARKHVKPHTVYCGCGEHQVSKLIYRRMKYEGKRYQCRKCRQLLHT